MCRQRNAVQCSRQLTNLSTAQLSTDCRALSLRSLSPPSSLWPALRCFCSSPTSTSTFTSKPKQTSLPPPQPPLPPDHYSSALDACPPLNIIQPSAVLPPISLPAAGQEIILDDVYRSRRHILVDPTAAPTKDDIQKRHHRPSTHHLTLRHLTPTATPDQTCAVVASIIHPSPFVSPRLVNINYFRCFQVLGSD